ncbi:hypothetical protein vseg_021392 [Gypsophila vaccaria]
MGTWEEESSALFESQNGGTHHHGENEVGVDFESKAVVVDGVSGGGGGGNDDNDCDDECGGGGGGDRVSDEVVRQFERVEIRNNESDDSKNDEETRGEVYGDDGKYQVYPLRPYAADCSFYVKTGSCKFGPNCRYNHPPKRGVQHDGYAKNGTDESYGSIADAGKIQCKYFQSPGGCKYGDACRYIHSTHKTEEESLELNFLGLPIRPSAQECTFYLRNGSCGYGANCRFNHPEFSSTRESEPENSITSSKSVRGGVNLPRNYAGEPLQSFPGVSQGTQDLSNGLNMRNISPYAPPEMNFYPAMRPNPGWNQNQVFSPFPINKTPLPHQAMVNFPKRIEPSPQYENPMQIDEFPERPGQPDCDYFMKTGNCKYRLACKFNHPMGRGSKLPLPPVSSKGIFSRPAMMLPAERSELLNSNSNNMRRNGMPPAHQQQLQMQNGEFPERAGQPECEYYMKTGQCKFKSSCKYHHPRSRVPTSLQCALSEKGLPLRPGAKLCRNYEQQGMCKYGRNCLFNHPDDHSPNIPSATQFHSTTNVTVPANSEPPAADNVHSAWDDGWGM